MQDEVGKRAGAKLDELELREELRALRRQIPDTPALNPIVNVAFDLSRRLEAGDIAFDELKALAGRLMDRACVERARQLRACVGFVDPATTFRDFSDYVQSTAKGADLEAFRARWERARTGIVLTAHPTFGLSNALSRRIVDIAVSDAAADAPIGLPHRPDSPITLEYEHSAAQAAIGHLREAYVDLLDRFYEVATAHYGDEAYKLAPKLASIASWVGYDLDGRTDIKWTFSFLIRLREKQAALNDIRDRFLALKSSLGDGAEVQRLSRQLTGKLDLAIAAADEQIAALEQIGPGGFTLAEAANAITRSDSYNLVSAEPLITLFGSLVDAVSDQKAKRAIAAISGLLHANGLGMSHIHLRVNAVQINNAFRAFVHEPWTRDLGERQALARIVEMVRNVKPASVNFETLDLETATAIRQFALAAQMAKHVDRDTPIRYLIASGFEPPTIVAQILISFFSINLALMIFNLIPIPPLDGSHVLYAMLDPRTAWRVQAFLTQYGTLILMVAIFLPIFPGGQTLIGLVFDVIGQPLASILLGT